MKKLTLKILSAVGILVSIYLVVNDVISPGYCPPFWVIPACYLVLLSFLGIFISFFMKNRVVKDLFFWISGSFGLILAIYFSINQLMGLKECPPFVGIPLCFVSFFSFGILMGLKVFWKD